MARHDGLDAARALAMFIVVATHAAISFMVTPVGWAIQDRSQHIGVDLYVWIIRAFAMPTFFWLSGYFSRLVLEGGTRAFIRHRITRVLLPFAIALIPCSLAISALWDWGREVGLRGEIGATVPRFQGSELPILLAHLWYLYYLLMFSAAALLLRRVRLSLPTLIVPFVMTTGALLYLDALHTNTPLGFVPDLPIAIYMGGFFAWGWLVHARPEQLQRYADHAWHALALAPALLAPIVLALHAGTRPPVYAVVASGLFSIAMIIGFLGLCIRYARHAHPVLRRASRASYWFYVAHLPLVVLLQIVLANSALPGPLKYALIVTVTTLVCLATYELGPQVKLQIERVVRARRDRVDAE